MFPILYQRAGFVVWSYPALLYCGVTCGVVAGNAAAHALGSDAFAVFMSTLLLIAPAIASARLFYVACHWGDYRGQSARIWNRKEGGLSLFGGLPAMLLLSVPVTRWMGIAIGEFWDAAVFTVMSALAIAKIGCFLQGCCGGRLESASGRRLPVQLWEAAWAAGVLLTGTFLIGRMPFRGAVFLAMAFLYCMGRVYLERYRERPGVGLVFSGATAIAAIVTLVLRWQ